MESIDKEVEAALPSASQKERQLVARLIVELRNRGTISKDFDPLANASAPNAEALMDANTQQRGIVERAYAVPSPGKNNCAEWVCRVFEMAGFGVWHHHAKGIYEDFCTHSGDDPLKVAMVVAVPQAPYDSDGKQFGHVGLYAGDRIVMDCVGRKIRRVPLSAWLVTYGVAAEPRWGWLGGIGLA
jgi:hypothetical protein